MYTQKRLFILFLLSTVLLISCTSGLKPLPNKIDDLSLSLSLPLANVEVGLSGLYHIGLPNYFLTENVPDWAKYDTIYFTDTVAVDLYRIYENSDNIKYLAFTINIWNEFPVKGNLNIHFVNNAGEKLYSFNPIGIDDGSFVLRNGGVLVVQSGYSKTNVKIDFAEIDSISSAEFLVFNMKLNLKDAAPYKFKYYDQLKMNCHIGARIDFILKDI